MAQRSRITSAASVAVVLFVRSYGAQRTDEPDCLDRGDRSVRADRRADLAQRLLGWHPREPETRVRKAWVRLDRDAIGISRVLLPGVRDRDKCVRVLADRHCPRRGAPRQAGDGARAAPRALTLAGRATARRRGR